MFQTLSKNREGYIEPSVTLVQPRLAKFLGKHFASPLQYALNALAGGKSVQMIDAPAGAFQGQGNTP